MQRRKFLELSSIASLFILTGCGGGENTPSNGSMGPRGGMGPGGGMGNTGDDNSPTPTSTKALPIPQALRGTQFNLQIQQAQHEFFDGLSTSTYGINSTYLGPTLFLRNGSNVSINYTNTLNENVSIHGHGMHLPPSMDGSAHQEMSPGGSWSAQYTVNQKACTNWYHSHTLHQTGSQTYKGIGGLIIIEDAQSDALNLPKRYGEDDIPLVLQDRRFNSNAEMNYSPNMRAVAHGYIGDTFIVNGAINPTFEAEAKEIRFRILNGANSTVYQLGFSDGRSFKQIATDNSFLEAPVTMTTLRLSPGERAEIIVDLSGALGNTFELREFNNNKTFMNINVSKAPKSTTSVPSRLTTLDKLNASTSSRTRSFTLEGRMGTFMINGKAMDINRIDENVSLNDVEIWEVYNSMPIDHNFHIHATHFEILDRNGDTSAVGANERGYKDTVFVPARQRVRFLVKMTDYTDATVPYMYHCHFLEHEDAGMMGQFLVT